MMTMNPPVAVSAALPRPIAARRSAPAAGVAALTVVMILFFVMALVAAYTNRSLVFEQRIATNSYRSARAIESAEAGLEWTVAMLNGGRIDNNCKPSDVAANSDFRRRYLLDLGGPGIAEGSYDFTWAANPPRLFPACITRAGVLQCICPTLVTRSPVMAAEADGSGSAFRIQLELPGSESRSGLTGVIALGCANPGSGALSCYAQQGTGALGSTDAAARAQINVGLLRAVPLAPIAALTAGGTVSVTAGSILTVSNSSSNAALTVHAGNLPLPPAAAMALTGPAGSGSDGLLRDSKLSDLAAAPNELWFRSLFAIDPVNFAALPATRTVACAGGGCVSNDLTTTLANFPRNPVLVAGNLNLDGGGALGTAADPVLLIVRGILTISSNVTLNGLVQADSVVWASPATVQGAVVATGDFAASTNATLSYRQDLLDTIRLRYGSFLRVPGSWKQLTAN